MSQFGRPVLLRMFRSAAQGSVVANLGSAGISDHGPNRQALSLDARLGLLRRRRRVTLLRQLAPVAPVLIGISALLIVAFGPR